MPNKDSVSVLIATFNGERYIKDQLMSLARQEILPDEVIVSDDLSSDSTLDIIDSFSKIAPFELRIIKRSTRVGAVENFFYLCSLANGKYIAFCDQDDYWEPAKLKVCIERLKSTDLLMVAHSVLLLDHHGKTIGRWDQGIKNSRGLYIKKDAWSNFLGMSIVFDRNLIDFVSTDVPSKLINPNLQKVGLAHDQWISFIADSINAICAVRLPLAGYRLHQNNVSGANKQLAKRLVQIKAEAGLSALPNRMLCQAAHQRAEFLLALASQIDNKNYRKVLKDKSSKWSELAERESKRTLLYSRLGLKYKIRIYTQLLLGEAYVGWDRGGVNSPLALKDLVLGVMEFSK